MATGALGVDFRFLVFDQLGPAGSVHKMTGGTSHLVFGMPRRDAAAGSALVQVTTKTGAIHLTGRKLGRVVNVVGGRGLGVFGAGTVTGFTAFLFPAFAGAGFDGEVGCFLEIVVDFFVTDLASIRTGIVGGLGGFGRLGGLLRGYREARGQEHD